MIPRKERPSWLVVALPWQLHAPLGYPFLKREHAVRAAVSDPTACCVDGLGAVALHLIWFQSGPVHRLGNRFPHSSRRVLGSPAQRGSVQCLHQPSPNPHPFIMGWSSSGCFVYVLHPCNIVSEINSTTNTTITPGAPRQPTRHEDKGYSYTP